MKYILGIDIGTTAIKAAVIGEDGEIYGTKTSEYPLTTLPSGEVEADLSLYEEAFKQSIKESVKNASKRYQMYWIFINCGNLRVFG